MLRRKACQIGIAFLLGAGWFVYDSPWWCVAFVVYMGGLYAGLRPHLLCTVQRRKRFLCVTLAFLCGSVVGEIAVQRQKEQHSFLQKDREVQFQGEIYKKESKADQPVYYLRDVILQDQKEQIKCSSIILYPDSDDDTIGTIYIGKAKITPFRQARNDGNFDEKIYYESNGIAASLEDAAIHKKIPSRRCVRIKLYELQQNIADVYGQYLFGEESGVLQTLALGEKGELDTDAKALYQMAGLSHILAISGVKTLKLDIPLVPETRINWAFMPLHIVIIYILKLCLDEEIIPRCRFPCSRGYFKKCINYQKKQLFSVSQSYCKSLINQQKEKKPMAYKKYREMKVYEASGYQYKRTPSIVLKGQWLSELGFDIGEQIEVKCEDGRLIITKANEIWT